MIPIAKPFIEEDDISGIISVLKSGMLSQGSVVEEFERMFSEYIGVKNAIAVSNGTTALDVALKAFRIGKGDEVMVPSFTFIATANVVLYQGAKPVFVDIDRNTYNIDPNDVLNNISPRTKAIIGVHLFGHPFDIKALSEICEDYGLILIEDCAQAHGAEYYGKRVGSFGIGCFSFYPTKNITTGEGGIITTDSDKIAERCRYLRDHGQKKKYIHIILGYNYRMTNIQAALGISQLRKLDSLNNLRIRNAEYYNKNIKAVGLKKPYKNKNVKHVYHQYVLEVEDTFPLSRDDFLRYLIRKGIGSAVHYPLPIYKQPLYRKLGFDERYKCPVTEEVCKRILSIPVHPRLSKDDLKYITETINGLGV